MSNKFQGITSGAAELKNLYQGPIVTQFNDDVPVYRAAEKVKKGWSGYQLVRPLKVRRNQGIGATTDGGNLPAIGRQTTQQALIPAKFLYLRFGVTGPMIKSSMNDAGSFVRAASFELDQGYADFKSDCNRQYSWDGTAYLAKLSAAAVASTTITVQGREGSTERGAKFLDVDSIVDIITSGGTIKASGVTITAVATPTSATSVLTLDQAVTASSGDFVVRTGAVQAGGTSNEMSGLLTFLDGGTTTIFNIDRSAYPQYQGNVINANSGQLTLDLMMQAYNAARERGGGELSAIWCDFDSQRYYNKLLTSDKRYVNTVNGDGGFGNKDKQYLEYQGVPVVADKDCPQRLFFLQADSWMNAVLSEMEFADETGTMYIAQTSADTFEVRLRFFANLFCEKPAANAVLKSYVSP